MLILGAVLAVLLAPASASAQSAWLDQPIQQWNQPGMPIPVVNRSGNEPDLDPRCIGFSRPAETAADAAIEAAGWSLFGSYASGWGVSIIYALSGHDGMCRPWAYHGFVFVDGQFAGTLAPETSASRSDGALTREVSLNDDRITASFVRYAPEDPLCCPSPPAVTVAYKVERTPSGPVVARTS